MDLNQIRAGEAPTPETSCHTSAYDRIAGRRQRLNAAAQGIAMTAGQTADGWLCELTLEEGLTANVRPTTAATTRRRASDKGLLPIKLDEYLQLLDTSGRIIREGKTGAIPDLPLAKTSFCGRSMHPLRVWVAAKCNRPCRPLALNGGIGLRSEPKGRHYLFSRFS